MNEEPKFFSPFETLQKHGGKLPHWQQPGATYFVTFRLADSLPSEQLREWRTNREDWLEAHPHPWDAETELEYHKAFSRSIDLWLDQGIGECLLAREEAASVVEDALLHFDPERYLMHSAVVMPNHVHALVSLGAEGRLEDLVKSWKGVSARRINVILNRSGKVWQKNYLDRMIRDAEHFFRVARYVRMNPEKGCVADGAFRLYETEAIRNMLVDS